VKSITNSVNSLQDWLDKRNLESISIDLESKWYKGLGTPRLRQAKNIGMITDEIGYTTIKTLFELVKEETQGEVTPVMHKDKVQSSKAFALILSNFRREIEEKCDIKQALEEKIQELTEFKFIIGLDKEFEYIYISLEEVIEMIKNLRKRRIALYKVLLEQYEKHRERFDAIFNSLENP